MATTPAAPKFLPAAVQKKWQDAYEKALKQAAIDHPEDESQQRAIATKEANRLLVVPAPESAEDIDALEDWQVLTKGTKNGQTFVVTADGRKYSFPVAAEEPAKGKKDKSKKDDPQQ
jgi:hypothetical protein